jgi:hypothetical protein
MKRLSSVFALTALGAATVALAQQPYSQPQQQQPPASTSQQTTPSKADTQALMKDCLTKVQAANPQASKEDVKAYCDQKLKEYSSQQSPEK